MNKKYTYYILIILFTLGIFICGSTQVEAAKIISTVSGTTVHQGDSITIDVQLDPESQSINAVAGGISFSPTNSLMLENISTNNSIINMWIKEPNTDQSDTLSWSGIIPSGFTGVLSPFYSGSKPGLLFKAQYKVEESGSIQITPNALEAYVSDGTGTPALITGNSITLTSIASSGDTTSNVQNLNTIDTTESASTSLAVSVTRSPLIQNNAWFVAFGNTSGATSVTYQVAETKLSQVNSISASVWKDATSPYVLMDQSRRSYVYVKEINKDGAVTVASVAPISTPTNSSSSLFVWVILMLAIPSLFLIRYIRKKR